MLARIEMNGRLANKFCVDFEFIELPLQSLTTFDSLMSLLHYREATGKEIVEEMKQELAGLED